MALLEAERMIDDMLVEDVSTTATLAATDELGAGLFLRLEGLFSTTAVELVVGVAGTVEELGWGFSAAGASALLSTTADGCHTGGPGVSKSRGSRP